MNTIKVCDPRINVKAEDEKLHAVLQGGLRYQQKTLPSNSWGSPGTAPTTAEFIYDSNSTKNIVDRFVRMRCYVEVKCETGPFLLGQHDALRQYPISSIIENITCQVNQQSVSDRVSDKIHALLTFGDRNERHKSNSVAPNMPDNYQEYNDWQTYGSAKNPLAEYGENNGDADPRGGFPVVVAPDGKSFTAVLTEPVMISPFFNGDGHQVEGFSNVNEITISVSWLQKLDRILSHSSGGNALGDVSVSFYKAPELLITEITPDLTQPRLLAQSLPYCKLDQHIVDYGTLSAGEEKQMLSDTYRLSTIPSCMYVFVRHKRSTADNAVSDAYCSLKNLRFTWNTETLFSSCSQQDLYEMSVRNGSNLSWQQWSKYRGSVLCISFGDQVGLIDGEAPGVRGQYTAQVQIDATNESKSDFDAELFVVFNFQGSFTIMENTASVKIGLLTPEDVLASARAMVEMPYADWKNLQGGSFWSGLKNIVNKVASGVGQVAGIAGKVLPALGPEFAPLAPIAKTAGDVAGVVSGLTGKGMTGGMMSGGRRGRKGGRLAGGRALMGRNGHGQYHPQYGSRLM